MVLSPIEQGIKRKIEAVGTPLREWDIQINYGIKTGYNDAFIISTARREEILSRCLTEDERRRTEELIRPILRGRDIKRYGYEWAGLWVINAHNGIKGKIPRVDIDEYPAVKAHLDQYWDKISKRTDKGDTPYNLRNCAYMGDFLKPKIVFAELARTGGAFALDKHNYIVSNTGYILTAASRDEDTILYLLAFLNSRVMLYCLNQISARFDESGWRWLRQFVEQLRVPMHVDKRSIVSVVKNVNRENQGQAREAINALVARAYNLTSQEEFYINQQFSKH